MLQLQPPLGIIMICCRVRNRRDLEPALLAPLEPALLPVELESTRWDCHHWGRRHSGRRRLGRLWGCLGVRGGARRGSGHRRELAEETTV